MATVGEALAATIDAQWNVGTGGTKPVPIVYLVEHPEVNPNPKAKDAVFVWLPLRRKFDNDIDVAEKYRNVTYTIRIECHTKTSSARQLEIENEVDRILSSGAPITGATKQKVLEINDISNRLYSVGAKFVSEILIEVFTAMEESATAYGTATATTITTDDLTANDWIKTPLIKSADGTDTVTLSAGVATFPGASTVITGATIVQSIIDSIALRWSGMVLREGGVEKWFVGTHDTDETQLVLRGNGSNIVTLDFDDDSAVLKADLTVGNDIFTDGDKTADIGATGIAWDNIYADDFVNESPFMEIEQPLDAIKAIKAKDGKLDYDSLPDWIRMTERDHEKDKTHEELITDDRTGKQKTITVIDEVGPKTIISERGFSMNRMILLLYQALQEATTKIEALEAAR